jgi:hypothetical protein
MSWLSCRGSGTRCPRLVSIEQVAGEPTSAEPTIDLEDHRKDRVLDQMRSATARMETFRLGEIPTQIMEKNL